MEQVPAANAREDWPLKILIACVTCPKYLDRRNAVRDTWAPWVEKLNPDAALQKAIYAAGFVPTSGEFDVTIAGTAYRGQRAERLSDGQVRVYFAVIGDWAHVQFVQRD